MNDFHSGRSTRSSSHFVLLDYLNRTVAWNFLAPNKVISREKILKIFKHSSYMYIWGKFPTVGEQTRTFGMWRK